jgi:hypothetical protein
MLPLPENPDLYISPIAFIPSSKNSTDAAAVIVHFGNNAVVTEDSTYHRCKRPSWAVVLSSRRS